MLSNAKTDVDTYPLPLPCLLYRLTLTYLISYWMLLVVSCPVVFVSLVQWLILPVC